MQAQISEIFKSSLAKDVFGPLAKILIGILTLIELYYIFVDKFTITPTLLTQLSTTNIGIFAAFITLSLALVVGYITCTLGTEILNLSSFLIKKFLREGVSKLLLPYDPFNENYENLDEYSKNMFQVVCNSSKLEYTSVGYEFFRLCNIVALSNESIFKIHIIDFNRSIARGLLINSILLLFILASTSSSVWLIILSIGLIMVIYNSNKTIEDNWREEIYDLAFITASKDKKTTEEVTP